MVIHYNYYNLFVCKVISILLLIAGLKTIDRHINGEKALDRCDIVRICYM